MQHREEYRPLQLEAKAASSSHLADHRVNAQLLP
jgi:hypothetical protein